MLDKVLNQFADYSLEPAQPLTFGKLTRCKTTRTRARKKTAGTSSTNTAPKKRDAHLRQLR